MSAEKQKRTQGRPRIVPEGGKRITITLDATAYAKAKELGQGNLSAGIRIAVERGLNPLPVSAPA